MPIVLRGFLQGQARELGLQPLAITAAPRTAQAVAAGWFDPVNPQALQVLGSAARAWFATHADGATRPRGWAQAGVLALILDADASGDAALRESVRAGGIDAWTSTLPAQRLVHAL